MGVHGDIQEDLFRGQLGREVARRLELGGVEPGEAVQVPKEGGGVTGDGGTGGVTGGGRGGGRQSGRGGWRGGRGASSRGARPSGRFCYRFGGSGGSGGRDRGGGPGTAATARDPGEEGPHSVVVEDCDAVVRCHPRVAPEGLGGAVDVDVIGAGRGGRGGARPEAHHVVQEGAGREKDLVAGLVVEAPAAQVGWEVEVAGRGSRVLPRRGELLELPDRKRAPTRRGVEVGLSFLGLRRQERHLVRLSLSWSRGDAGTALSDALSKATSWETGTETVPRTVSYHSDHPSYHSGERDRKGWRKSVAERSGWGTEELKN